ncbi:MAG: biopolymer transporter ExbD [Planctomycetota bacterium]|jgi:biopolymer transport protein ExbD|nr:biopolymer transporter ExbD [Planctomycetota bacterium]
MKAMRDDEVCDIPMTSLIDVVFLLLIFFLVATNFTRREMDHSIVLPNSEAGTDNSLAPVRLVVNIRNDGSLVVNGRMVDDDAELRNLVAGFVSARPGRPAVIRADARVPYRVVMRVFGICRAGGVARVDLPVLDSGGS